MSIQPSGASPALTYGSINQLNKDSVKTDENKPAGLSQMNPATGLEETVSKQTMQIQAQASLIQHLFGEGAPKDSNALKILYQEAIGKINEALESELGPNAISQEKLDAQGGMEYWSPENTADRIVQGTVGFFEAYKAANPNLEGEELLDRFLGVIGGGVEEGFQDATDLLKGFGVYEGSVKENAEKTYDLVQKGFQAFREKQLEQMGLKPVENLTPTEEPPVNPTENQSKPAT